MTIEATDLTVLSPPEIDEMWSEATAPAAAAMQRANETVRSAKRYLKFGGYHTATGERLMAQGTAARDAARVAYREASAPFDAEFERRGGWTRYLQVVASNGHVHSPYCHTLTPGQTFVQPVFELSGQDGAGVVVAAGHTACSKCFPDAPTQTAADKRAANVAKGRCGGTGQRAESVRPSGRYGVCSECRGVFGVSTNGIVRPHKAAR